MIRLIFRDTGIGMSKEYIPHIFDAFSQEDSSSTNKYGSTGLGMPITKSIVELMNGQIGITCDTAESGWEGIDKVRIRHGRREDYNLILVDWKMPEMDGLEATRRIRAMDRPDAGKIPIIALTANAYDDDVQRSMQADKQNKNNSFFPGWKRRIKVS